MEDKSIIVCGLLGAREEDLYLLSELHKNRNVRVAFVYDPKPEAVGLEIAEILGIPRLSSLAEAPQHGPLDYIVVCGPRSRYGEVLRDLSDQGFRIIGQEEALKMICQRARPAAAPRAEESTLENTLAAIEKIFDKKELLKFLLDVSVHAVGASAGSIMLYSPEAAELFIGYAIGLSDRIVKSTRQKLGEGIAGQVALTKEARLIKPNGEEHLYDEGRDRMDIASAVSVPLLWQGDLLGVLNVSTTRGERPLDYRDLDKLTGLSRRISKVLFESLKLQQVRLRHQEVRIKSAMGRITRSEGSLREKCSLLSSYLAEALGAETVELYLSLYSGDWFTLSGSNRRYAPQGEGLLGRKGVLARCFLERRSVILREEKRASPLEEGPFLSTVYYPIVFDRPLGVMVLEYEDRAKLNELLVVRESLGFEVGRFLATELRERAMRRELQLTTKAAQSAPALLTCKGKKALAEELARRAAEVIECRALSLRIRWPTNDDYSLYWYERARDAAREWKRRDQELFSRLRQEKKAFTEAVLRGEVEVRGPEPVPYRSALAVPIMGGGEAFLGGVVAYDKEPAEPIEEGLFGETERRVLEQLLALAAPLIEGREEEGEEEEVSYQDLLRSNRERFLQICQQEIERSHRYHHSFTVLLFQIKPLGRLFARDYAGALRLVDEITRGIQTRTRKTDQLAWIEHDSFALLCLEGAKRVRFLISRAAVYLRKDLSSLGSPQPGDLLVGQAGFPGRASTAEELMAEASSRLEPIA